MLRTSNQLTDGQGPESPARGSPPGLRLIEAPSFGAHHPELEGVVAHLVASEVLRRGRRRERRNQERRRHVVRVAAKKMFEGARHRDRLVPGLCTIYAALAFQRR